MVDNNSIQGQGMIVSTEFKKICSQFYSNYENIASYGTNLEHKLFLGDKSNQVCRFCGRKKGDVTFRKDAHALSNLIGNNRLFSYYECDDCNSNKFSKYESEFSNFMNLYHSLSQIKGKSGIPSYKSRPNDFSRVDIKDVISVLQKEDEQPIVNLDEENNIIHFIGKRTYVPVNVYKTLLKMALTIIPNNEIPEVKNAMDFLMDRKKIKGQLKVGFRQYGGNPPFPTPVAMLFKRKNQRQNTDVPLYMFLLAYGNFVFQFHIPFCDSDKFLFGKAVNMPYVPTIADAIYPVPLKTINLSSDEKVIKEKYSVYMSYETIEKTGE